MKLCTTIILTCLLISTCSIALAEQFILTIDGKQFEIELGVQRTIQLPNGSSVTLNLKKKPIATFEVDFFSFEYSTSLSSPARADVGDGIHQTMCASPLGTVVMVQEYRTLDPSFLVDMLLNEITKESKEYGYRITTEEVTKTLVDGKRVRGKRATATYGSEVWHYNVLAYGKKDQGVVMVSVIDVSSASPSDRRMIERFWNTLKLFPNIY